MQEYVGYRIPWAAINNVVLTNEEVVRCKDCAHGNGCETRTGLSDPMSGFCSNGERKDIEQ